MDIRSPSRDLLRQGANAHLVSYSLPTPCGDQVQELVFEDDCPAFEAMLSVFCDADLCPDSWALDLASLPFFCDEETDSDLVANALKFCRTARGW